MATIGSGRAGRAFSHSPTHYCERNYAQVSVKGSKEIHRLHSTTKLAPPMRRIPTPRRYAGVRRHAKHSSIYSSTS